MELMNKVKVEIGYLRDRLWYIIAIAVMAFVSAVMLLYEFYAPNADVILIEVFQDLDLAIAYIFLIDFSAGLYVAPKKIRHIRNNWLDLIGSIPFSDGFFRALRILRFTRLVRFLKAINTGLNIKGSIRDLNNKKVVSKTGE